MQEEGSSFKQNLAVGGWKLNSKVLPPHVPCFGTNKVIRCSYASIVSPTTTVEDDSDSGDDFDGVNMEILRANGPAKRRRTGPSASTSSSTTWTHTLPSVPVIAVAPWDTAQSDTSSTATYDDNLDGDAGDIDGDSQLLHSPHVNDLMNKWEASYTICNKEMDPIFAPLFSVSSTG